MQDALGEVDMAIGGDQGGSVRMPAAWTGCVGLKPTFGLVPVSGAIGEYQLGFSVTIYGDSFGMSQQYTYTCKGC